MKMMTTFVVLFTAVGLIFGNETDSACSCSCVRVKLGQKWFSAQQMEETANKYVQGKDNFTGKDVETNIWIEVVDSKQSIHVDYSSGIGKPHWLVTIGEGGKVTDYKTEIISEGR